MKIVMFYHSLLSDWNHGNAHFLRGITSELLNRGHEVRVLEPRNSWSAQNLVAEHGRQSLRCFHAAYPALKTTRYHDNGPDLERLLDGVDLVLVHEWNAPNLVRRIGEHHRRTGGYSLFFHDTHHRMVTAPHEMSRYDLGAYDGVLAYGKVLEEFYRQTGQARRAWTWHEAADTRVFRPLQNQPLEGDLVWIGNWGDNERAAELEEFLIRPSRALRLRTRVYGVRYPRDVCSKLQAAGIEYCGWLPNFEVPRVFARNLITIHVPRRPYVKALPGIPTIRPFEALACGIPLVSSPWSDAEGLFRPGRDFLVVQSGREMEHALGELLRNQGLRRQLAANGLDTIRRRHTCAHRVDQLLDIHAQVQGHPAAAGIRAFTTQFFPPEKPVPAQMA